MHLPSSRSFQPHNPLDQNLAEKNAAVVPFTCLEFHSLDLSSLAGPTWSHVGNKQTQKGTFVKHRHRLIHVKTIY